MVGGRRVSKDSTRVWACGTVDELSSALGLARACNAADPADGSTGQEKCLSRIQQELFSLGAELATPAGNLREGMPRIVASHVAALEKLIDELNAQLGPLEEFILPGGSPTGAALHLARTVCRRAERYCVRLALEEPLGEWVVPYLNRLGDALFVLARRANRQRGVAEPMWEK